MRFTLDTVERASRQVLRASGASQRQADSVAASIRDAEAEGNRDIGLRYLPFYCRHLSVGKIIGDAQPTVTTPMPSLVGVDAAGGFAHAAYDIGEAAFVEAARSQGIALLGIENAYACGVLGYFTGRLARAGLIGVMTANASSTMAPWGGVKPFFGTNPWSFAAPRHGDPLIIDSSSSATAFINLANAAAAREPIPDTWALDSDGRPTTDAASGLAGTIAPAGGHKGAVIALMVEVMSAGLTRANWSHRASSLGDDEGGPPKLGQTLIAIRPDGLGQTAFAARLEQMLAEMSRDRGARIPGDRRHQNRAMHERDGVEIDSGLLKTLGVLGVLGHGSETSRCAGHAAIFNPVAASVSRAFCSARIWSGVL